MLGLVSTSTKLLNLGGLGDSWQRHLSSKFDELQEGECGQAWELETPEDHCLEGKAPIYSWAWSPGPQPSSCVEFWERSFPCSGRNRGRVNIVKYAQRLLNNKIPLPRGSLCKDLCQKDNFFYSCPLQGSWLT